MTDPTLRDQTLRTVELPPPDQIRRIANDALLMEVGRLAVEDALIEWRDSRLSTLGRRNGLVVAEKDGTRSDIIRFGTETAVAIALRAIAGHIEDQK